MDEIKIRQMNIREIEIDGNAGTLEQGGVMKPGRPRIGHLLSAPGVGEFQIVNEKIL
jgi:hypothetical protein